MLLAVQRLRYLTPDQLEMLLHELNTVSKMSLELI